jgi:hypothetical protein
MIRLNQRVSQFENNLFAVQIFKNGVQVSEGVRDCFPEGRIGRDPVAHERQRTPKLPKSFGYCGRINVERSEPEALFCAGVAVMKLVRMEHKNLAWQAVLGSTAIAE